jgi:hypothetical protein
MGLMKDTAYVLKLQTMKEEDREALAEEIRIKYAFVDSDWKHLNMIIALKTTNEVMQQLAKRGRN